MSTPRKARTSETAWYRCVEAISTDVTVPMVPACTTASREACPGMRVYCSPTWTSPEAPTSCHSDRRPSISGAGGVSARTLAPAATSSRTTTGMAGQLTAEMTNSGSRARASSIVRIVGTPQRAAMRCASTSVCVTTATTSSRSGAALAIRMWNSERHPLPMIANLTGATGIASFAVGRGGTGASVDMGFRPGSCRRPPPARHQR